MPLTSGSYTIETPTRSTMMNWPKSPKIASSDVVATEDVIVVDS